MVDLPGMNVILWKFGNKSSFTVKSVYNALSTNDVGPYHKKIWKGKITSKIKIFLWLVVNNAILTKDNLIRRKWAGNPTCHFCDEERKAFLICYFNVVLPKWCGQWWLMPLVLIMSLEIFSNAGSGVKNGYPMDRSFILWALQLYAGLSGELGMISALKKKK